MKKLLVFASFILIAGFTSKVMAQIGTSSPTSASAKILAAMTLTQGSTNLNFGTMTVPTAATTVTISSSGVLSNGGNITLLTQAPIASVAAYTVGGTINTSYAITLPSSPITLTSGSNTMTVDTFTSNKTDDKSTLDGVGADSFAVGATLNLGADQPAGSYSGSFNVTVAYN